jgi:L-glutamine-phosphate cytidylyltransferase
MTGIVIAAGRGLRMRPFTDERPKCMLPVNGQPLLSYTLRALRAAGCDRIVIVTGHLAGAIDAPGCTLVHNGDFEHNNILHSLMFARDAFDDDVLVTYSDIFVEPSVHHALASAPGDIVLAVDRDWRGYYEGRTLHPAAEAEKAYVGDTDRGPAVTAIGKHLDPSDPDAGICGEFLGLWKMTRAGAQRFRQRFEAIDARLGPDQPFRAAARWRQAYVTDLFADLIASGDEVRCLLIERGWAELDLLQDYERLPAMIGPQRLFSLESSS